MTEKLVGVPPPAPGRGERGGKRGGLPVALWLPAVVFAAACGPAPSPGVATQSGFSPAAEQAGLSRPSSVDERVPGWVGVVLARESADVAAQRAGRIRAVRVRVGARVKQGQVLALLETEELERDLETARAATRMARAELAGAEAKLQQRDAEFGRRRRAPELFSGEQLHLAELEASAARAEKEAAEARLAEREAAVERLLWSLGQTEIRAPFSGTVAQRFVDSGDTAERGDPVVRLLTSDLMVRFAVPEDQAGSLSVGDGLEVEAGSGIVVGGEVSRAAPEVDIPSQTVFFEARLNAAAQALVSNQGVFVRPAGAAAGAGGGGPGRTS